MGLESINYTYSTSLNVRDLLREYGALFDALRNRYAVIKGDDVLIEIEIESNARFYIRIALCNSFQAVFKKLDGLFDFLLNKNPGKLKDLNSKKEFKKYTNSEMQEIRSSYRAKKIIFEQMY